MKTPFGL